MSDSSKWHWSEGMKYALEGIKLMFILNGASAVSILTFLGNTREKSSLLIVAMIFFALGAACGIPTMLCAYLTQLHYGNAEFQDAGTYEHEGLWQQAVRFHYSVYVFVALGILFFLIGIVCAASGLM